MTRPDSCPHPRAHARRRPAALAVAAVAAVALVLAGGCSSDDAEPAATTVTSTTITAAADPPPTDADATADTVAPAGPVDTTPVDVGTVAIAESGVGPILVDSRGKALYVFLDDTVGGAPTCTDVECAAKWPAALASDVVAADGVDAAALGTVERPDGTSQLTIGGLPAYTMAADLTDGEPSCQGGEDVWWAVAPDGTINRTLP